MNAPAHAKREATHRARTSPYQGIVPFGEEDAEWFFGREESREIVADNLHAYRVSVFYGESGVGKTSLLHASVLPRLRADAERQLASIGTADTVAVAFADWSVEDPLDALKEEISRAVGELAPQVAGEPPAGPLADVVAAWGDRVGGMLVLVLDQFEELFRYHAADAAGRAFEEELAGMVRSRDASANVLISIREDSLARLDRLKERLPGLLDNLLRLEHLDREAAREAIIRPLERWYGLKPGQAHIEPSLVEAVLTEVETGKLLISGTDGAGRAQSAGGEARIEAPYVQLVLTRIWDEERALGSDVLRLETFERLGGAETIVRTHLDNALSSLSRRERAMAAKAFRFLVTPSGTKIALQPNDLAAYAEVRPEKLDPLLKVLAGEPRILRPVTGGAYQIYHDVLAAAMLDWGRRYDESQRSSLWAQRFVLLAAASVSAITAVAYLGNIPSGWEARTVDARFSIRGSTGPPKDVVIVAIDNKTFNDLNVQWPFPRRYEAKVIKRIAAAGAKAIAIDLQFTEPTDPTDDNKLFAAVSHSHDVVLGSTEFAANGRSNVFGGQIPTSAHVANALFLPDSDGTIRHMDNSIGGVTTFAIATAALARGKSMPPPRSGSHWINYAGPAGTVRRYSFGDVYLGRVPPRTFADKIVVIGTTAPSLQDLHPASTGPVVSGAEVQANSIETAVRGFPLSSSRWLNVVIIVTFGMLPVGLGMLPLARVRLRAVYIVLIAVLVGGLYTVGVQFLFDHGWVLVFVYPLAALAVTTAFVVARDLSRPMSR